MKRVIVSLCLASVMMAAAAAQYAAARGEVIFPDKTRVSVELAVTPEERARGLMFRTEMAPNEGMVFVFEEPGFYPFWMKNTLIPLDMVWVDAGYRVVSIQHSVPPCKKDPCPNFSPSSDNAVYVVELVSGFARDHGLKKGDTLVFKNVPKPKAPAVSLTRPR